MDAVPTDPPSPQHSVDLAQPPSSLILRKLHPERQPLSAEELLVLLQEDALSRNFELESQEMEGVLTGFNEVKVKSCESSEPEPVTETVDVNKSVCSDTAESTQNRSSTDLQCAVVSDVWSDDNSQKPADSDQSDWANFDDK